MVSFSNNYPNLANWQYQPASCAPSAPPEEEMYPSCSASTARSYPAPSAPAAPVATQHATAGVNLEDECTICLEKFSEKPTDYPYNGVVLSKTECNHFFHDFCLEQHLKVATHKDCPLCRHPVKASKITWIPVESIANPPASNPVPPPPAYNPAYVQEEPAPTIPSAPQPQATPAQNTIDLAKVTAGVAGVTFSLGKTALWGLGKVALGTLKITGSVLGAIASAVIGQDYATAMKNKKKLEDSSIQQLNHWGKTSHKMSNQLKVQNEEVELVYTTIYSLPPDKNYQAKDALKRMDVYTKIFEQKLKDAHLELQKSLENEKKILAS